VPNIIPFAKGFRFTLLPFSTGTMLHALNTEATFAHRDPQPLQIAISSFARRLRQRGQRKGHSVTPQLNPGCGFGCEIAS
jgi:hypothetical protein